MGEKRLIDIVNEMRLAKGLPALSQQAVFAEEKDKEKRKRKQKEKDNAAADENN